MEVILTSFHMILLKKANTMAVFSVDPLLHPDAPTGGGLHTHAGQ